MNSRISIKEKVKEIQSGRWEERLIDYYECWCTPLELYGKELYEAQNIKYENILVFKVRYCEKIKGMRKTDKKKFVIVFEEAEYEVFQVDFKGNSKNFVFIKSKMVI